MKNLLVIWVLALTVFSCQSAKDEFTIKGAIAGVETGKVYLQKIVDGRPKTIDSTNLEGGKFAFKGKMEIPDMRILKLNRQDYFAQFFLDNSDIKVVAKKDSLLNTKITGSPTQDIFQIYLSELENLNKEAMKLQEKYQAAMTSGNTDEAKKVEIDFTAMNDNMKVFIKNFVKEHNTSVVSAYITYISLIQQSIPIEGAELDSIIAKFPAAISKSEYVIKIKEIAEGLKKTAIGAVAPDFTLNDPEGKPIQLSSLRGKVVLIDFWASWCKPCRQENPNVVKLYQKYNGKGFQILGVSLDQSKEEWMKAIKEDQLSWSHVCDLQNDAARLYSVSQIPQSFLLDKEGKIIAKGLRGEKLAEKLNESFPQ